MANHRVRYGFHREFNGYHHECYGFHCNCCGYHCICCGYHRICYGSTSSTEQIIIMYEVACLCNFVVVIVLAVVVIRYTVAIFV